MMSSEITGAGTIPSDTKRAAEAGGIDFRGHIAELDGLRAVGLSLVVLNHFSMDSFPGYVFQLGNLGWIAMDSFFVMSGFLITGILWDSREKPRYFSVYYARRALRIFPLYYVVLLAWFLILRQTNYGNDYRMLLRYWGSPGWYAFYLGNLRQMWVTIPLSAIVSAPGRAFGPFWSLQVEEQFYLLFPLAVAWLSKENLKKLLIGAVVLSPVMRCLFYVFQPDNLLAPYTELPCHAEGIALGALIALRFRGGPWRLSKPSLSAWTGVLMTAACAGSVLSTWGTRSEAWTSRWDRLGGYTISAAACACLVLWLIAYRGSRWTWLLRTPPLRYLGKISYGMYLLHPLAQWMVLEMSKKRLLHLHKNDPKYVIVGVGLSLALASLSWYLFEGPLLRLKDRIGYSSSRLPAPMAIQGAAGKR